MKRDYPTYIHYIETEARSKGEFVVRTVPPRFIVKVKEIGPNYSFEDIHLWDNFFDGFSEEEREKKMAEYSNQLNRWYKSRIAIWKGYEIEIKLTNPKKNEG